MTAKFGAARRRAFLAALGATGNQTLAAERAKVSLTWTREQRKRDPAFAQAWEAALDQAAVALSGHDARRPPSGWGFLDGAELVVRGTAGSDLAQASGGREGKRIQIARAQVRQWSPRVETRFLKALAATCNVKASCAEIGMTPGSAYRHRKRWPAFARRWDATLDAGFVHIEMGLIDAAGVFLAGEHEIGDPGAMTGMTVAYAMELLEMRQRAAKAKATNRRKRFWWVREPDIEEVRAEIMRKVEAIERHDPERLARQRAEWTRRRPSSVDDAEPGCG